jgi:hypothetical protein
MSKNTQILRITSAGGSDSTSVVLFLLEVVGGVATEDSTKSSTVVIFPLFFLQIKGTSDYIED